ncbi:MAG TPA: hypothetical protein VK338_00505 [Candidatus Nitrosocosmicus sp.]|nr:hypothetical protein [Candidatus Nitrosocosmicus sp.]
MQNSYYSPASHRQKKMNRRIYVYLIFLVALILFMATIGVKLLINVSLFIAGNKDDTSTSQDQNSDLILPPTIDDIPEATNSATIKIKGTSSSKGNLTLYVNNKKKEGIRVRNEEYETTVNLQKGENEIYVVLENPKIKLKKESEKYKVLFKNEKPKLEISSPKDGDKVNKNEITIQGQTDKDVTITINDAPVVVDAQQNFAYNLRLTEGENTFTISAVDYAGNTETKELKVTYQKEE